MRLTGSDRSASRKGILLLCLLAVTLLGAAGSATFLIWPTAVPGSSPEKLDRLGRAKVAYADQDFVQAEEHLRALLDAGDTRKEVRLLLGRVLLEFGRISESRDLYNAIHRESPQTVEALLGLAACHERLGEFHLAVAVLKRASEMKKGDWRILRLLAMAQSRRGGDSMAALFTMKESLKIERRQEDLSKMMSDIGTARTGRPDPAAAMRNPMAMDPFDAFDPKPSDPTRFPHRPEVSDPLRGLPQPGGRRPR